MKTKNHITYLKIATQFCVAIFLLFSCQNKVEEVIAVNQVYLGPMETQENVDYTFTDSAKIQLRITAPLVENYSQLDDPVLKFNKGIYVVFYDNNEQEESYIKADAAERDINKKLWVARGDVEAKNQITGEVINTELMYWDEQKGIIYSDKFVKITTPDNVILGEGFEADQNFNSYRIFNGSGTFNLEEDFEEIEENE